ncbi:hypothetical protein FM102_12845 [Corynebacterium glutamicum]|nr:hypothetical protein FM102_12845 [Corynebacterium glutamicum]
MVHRVKILDSRCGGESRVASMETELVVGTDKTVYAKVK